MLTLIRPCCRRCLSGQLPDAAAAAAGGAAIPLDLEAFNRSGLFGVVVHAVHHFGKLRLRKN